MADVVLGSALMRYSMEGLFSSLSVVWSPDPSIQRIIDKHMHDDRQKEREVQLLSVCRSCTYFSIGKEPSWLDRIDHAYCARYNSYVCTQVPWHRPCPRNEYQIDAAQEWDADRGPETEMQQIAALGTVTLNSLCTW